MAGDKIRSIKPSIRRDQKLGRCSDSAKWLFITMMTMADDHGVFEAAPEVLAAEAFKWGPARDVAALCLELEGLVTFYEVDGQRYGHLNGWQKHQRIDNGAKPELPLPPGWVAVPLEKKEGSRVRTYWRAQPPAGDAHPVDKWRGAISRQVEPGAAPHPTGWNLAPLDRIGEEGKGREGRGEGAAPPAPAAPPPAPPASALSPSPVGGRVLIVPTTAEALNPRAGHVFAKVAKARHLFPTLDDGTLAGLARDLEATAAAETALDGVPIKSLLERAITGAQTFAAEHPLAGDIGVALELKKKFGYCVSDEVKALRRDRDRAASRATAAGKAPPPAPVDAELVAADADASEARIVAEAAARAEADAAERVKARELAEALKAGRVSSFIGNGPRPNFRAKPQNDPVRTEKRDMGLGADPAPAVAEAEALEADDAPALDRAGGW